MKAWSRKCTKCSEVSLGQKYAWNFTCTKTQSRCCIHLKNKSHVVILVSALWVFLMVQIARHEKYQNATLECLFRLLPIMFFFTWVRSNFLVCLILELTPPLGNDLSSYSICYSIFDLHGSSEGDTCKATPNSYWLKKKKTNFQFFLKKMFRYSYISVKRTKNGNGASNFLQAMHTHMRWSVLHFKFVWC